MLVLSRRLDQAIVIAGQVRVTVVAITPNRVELGVEAPDDAVTAVHQPSPRGRLRSIGAIRPTVGG